MTTKISEPTRSFEEDMAYPQYHYKYDNSTISTTTWEMLQKYIIKINESTCLQHPHVVEHHNNILMGIVPFNMRIVGTK